MARDEHHMTLGVASFGLAVGLAWAVMVFALGLVAGVLVAWYYNRFLLVHRRTMERTPE